MEENIIREILSNNPSNNMRSYIWDKDNLKKIINILLSVKNEETKCAYIYGDRHVGKTTFGNIIKYINNNNKVTGFLKENIDKEIESIYFDFYISNEVRTNSKKIENIIKSINKDLQEVAVGKYKSKIYEIIDTVNITAKSSNCMEIGVSVKFRFREDYAINIIKVLDDAYKKDKDGLIIIIDNFSSICDIENSGRFIKEFLEYIIGKNYQNLLLVLIGNITSLNVIKNEVTQICKDTIIHIKPLNLDQVKNYFKKYLNNCNKKTNCFEDICLKLYQYTSGYPLYLKKYLREIHQLRNMEIKKDNFLKATDIYVKEVEQEIEYIICRLERKEVIILKAIILEFNGNVENINLLNKKIKFYYSSKREVEKYLQKLNNKGLIHLSFWSTKILNELIYKTLDRRLREDEF
ncbi:hypothetical protein CLOACE_18540 [Clostridium acetireducens DSM 10703]|uniref:ATPase domain-containing protein n=1 Tax=Clostridium acetireducens DSM 10703 TaxID=1121290 RepID=A0A1E8EXQ2_9CLOT|nr:ATP-binding protein [Clostridium acetireducens]OFI05286.1 hypothetical protein CLOACE_18540 [Clostridium acetireducens DSM 10703]